MTRILLIRHGSTDWNDEGRLQGQVDIPLNARGLQQAVEMAEKLRGLGVAAIYSSDLRRARQTAQAAAQALNLELRLDANLREVCLGDWQGRLVSELEVSGNDSARFADRLKYPAAVAPPGGETAVQVLERLLRSVERIAHDHPQDTVVVVTHGFAVALLLSHFRDIPIDQVWDFIPGNGEVNPIII